VRPPKEPRSALRYPLDAILGSEVQVRLIRVLIHEVTEPLSVADIARLAGTTTVGARKALERLEAAGFAERIGSGHALKFQLRESAVAREALARAFEMEHRYYDELIGGLREAVSLPEVEVAWYEPLPSSSKMAIHLVVVVSAKDITWMRGEIRSRLAATENRFDVIVEVAIHSKADAHQPGPHDVALWGVALDAEATARAVPRTHAEATARSLLAAQATAELIRTDPTLIRRAEQHLDRLIHEGQGMATADLVEWRQLLQTYSPERVRDLLVSPSSRGERLRRSAPFMAVLTPEEREQLLGGLETE
jgi:hypothetical protein